MRSCVCSLLSVAAAAFLGEELWSLQVDTGSWFSTDPHGAGTLYAASDEATAYDLAKLNGNGKPKKKWSFPVPDNKDCSQGGRSIMHAADADADGNIYFGTNTWCAHGAQFFKVSAAGKVVWSVERGEQVNSFDASTAIPASGGMAFAVGNSGDGSGDAHVYALDIATGEEQWQHRLGGEEGLNPFSFVNKPLTESDGSVLYLASENTIVYAINASSVARKWEHETVWKVTARLTLHDGVLFVAEGGLTVLDAATGKPRWSFSPETLRAPQDDEYSTPVVDNGKVFVKLFGILYALDVAGQGQPLWSETVYGLLREPLLDPNGNLVVATWATEPKDRDFTEFRVHAPSNGRKLWNVTVPNRYNEECLDVGSDGTVYCRAGVKLYALKNGTVQWTVDHILQDFTVLDERNGQFIGCDSGFHECTAYRAPTAQGSGLLV